MVAGSSLRAADVGLRLAAAVGPAAAPGAAGVVPGSRTGVLATVRGIVVDSSLAPGLDALLAAAAASGVALAGSGYRDPSQQVAVRRANCGSSAYAIYEMSPSQCHPTTARPGASMHEQGLAIDFTAGGALITSRSSAGYRWMATNASRFGFFNLPSEPWHWSANGN
jgi:LAS superfamily LD-carboxypeptidase LdcB